jgi:hypothetical protein
MEAVAHDLTHFFQTAEVNCGYTALAMQLSHYGSGLTPEDIYLSAPRIVADGVERAGSLASQLAAWALGAGYEARLTTFDFLIMDLAWASLDGPALVARLTAVRDTRDVPSLGRALSQTYVDEYVRYLEAGGQLVILPHVNSESIYEKLRHGPVGVSVCMAPLYGHGRMSAATPCAWNSGGAANPTIPVRAIMFVVHVGRDIGRGGHERSSGSEMGISALPQASRLKGG